MSCAHASFAHGCGSSLCYIPASTLACVGQLNPLLIMVTHHFLSNLQPLLQLPFVRTCYITTPSQGSPSSLHKTGTSAPPSPSFFNSSLPQDSTLNPHITHNHPPTPTREGPKTLTQKKNRMSVVDCSCLVNCNRYHDPVSLTGMEVQTSSRSLPLRHTTTSE